MRGLAYTSSTVVDVRSNSRHSRTMSDDRLTTASGKTSAASSATRRSWHGLAYACRKHTATPATPCALSASNASRVAGSSSGTSSSPSRLSRSGTSSRK